MHTNSYPDPSEIADLTARMLLEVNAVHFKADDPYTLASGLKSPVYIDCRKLISYPRVRSALMDFAVATLFRQVGFEQFDAIAGGETAGIPFAAWIADRLDLPMQYVRKKPKGYGRDAQIEGVLTEGQRVLLVEDLATDGGSKLKFAEALRKAGAITEHTLVLFFYDVFDGSRQTLTKHDLSLHYLATWRDVLAAARKGDAFDAATLNEVERFLGDPLGWSKDRGGVYELPD